MNTTFIKVLKCFSCCKCYSIEEVNFPEEVFDLIRKYKVCQLFWQCDKCKNLEIVRKKPIREIDVHEVHPSRKGTVEPPKLHTGPYRPGTIVYCTDDNEMGTTDIFSRSTSSGSSRSPSPPDKNRSARKYTQKILDLIKIPQDDQSTNKKILNEVLDILLTTMKKSEMFKEMFNRLYYTGSAYNDLRITSATEYDIDVVLKVPRHFKLTPELCEGNSAFVKLRWDLSNSVGADNVALKFFNKTSDENYINLQEVLSWFQSHIDLALKQDIQFPDSVSKVLKSASGPARTIIICTNLGYEIHVDLVPVFEFECDHLSTTPFYQKVNEFILDKNEHNIFFTVPKECTNDKNISVLDSKLYWRLDFPNFEKHILSEKECVKSVIKILKIFRDKTDWKSIASYYLTMVVILEVLKNPSKEYWKNRNIYTRLLDCFKQLKIYLADGELPHFLTQHNLFYKLKAAQCRDWSNYLKNVITSWELDPENILQFLKDA